MTTHYPSAPSGHLDANTAFSMPTKICDGLFMADLYIAQDAEFFETNLVTHVINCAGQEVPNNKKISDVAFLTFDWSENTIQNITQQKVVSVTVNFIQDCRKEAGCLLIHYAKSQSRPFCLLACYFMVRFKWSLFKTLQFLNSRKEDVELEPAFFEQLTAFSQKLQDKGLMRSKTWVTTQAMTDEEIILTNTYLNSKNKFGSIPHNYSSKNKNKNCVNWKKDIAIQYVYCPNSVIIQKNDKILQQKAQKIVQRKSLIESSRDRNEMNSSQQKKQQSLKKVERQTKNVVAMQKPNISMSEMNVTKKWAQMRQMWNRQKQNHNGANTVKGKLFQYSEMSQKQSAPIITKKDNQKINDRLQDKLNILKKHEQKIQQNNRNSVYSKPATETTTEANTVTQRVEQKHQYQHNQNRYLHNNWIIDNQVVDGLKSTKNKDKITVPTNNKSVIIVKPNHVSSLERNVLRDSSIINNNSNFGNTGLKQQDQNAASRNSLRKVPGSERKDQNNSSLNKQNANSSKFFRNEAVDIISTKGRCSSAKPQRKQNTTMTSLGLGLTKNVSLKGKGKWKF